MSKTEFKTKILQENEIDFSKFIEVNEWKFVESLKKLFICKLRNFYYECEFNDNHKENIQVAKISGKKYFIFGKDKDDLEHIRTSYVLFQLQQ